MNVSDRLFTSCEGMTAQAQRPMGCTVNDRGGQSWVLASQGLPADRRNHQGGAMGVALLSAGSRNGVELDQPRTA
jgi:hypothetical protein